MDKATAVFKAITREELNHMYDIRRRVFVEEQGCPAELEFANEEDSIHFLALHNGEPAGAARWRKTENGYKLERFAVLKEFRGSGIGKALVRTVLDDIPEKTGNVYLNAQLPAISFYHQFGFRPVGKQFKEAGIMHQQMRLVSGAQRPGLP